MAGAAWGRVRALIDDKGDAVKEALPSTPVQVLGFDVVPAAGDEFRVTDQGEDGPRHRRAARAAVPLGRPAQVARPPPGTGAKLEDIFEQIQRGETATLNLVLKADVQGSLEAVTESLRKLERDEVKLTFVHRAVGGITENDVHAGGRLQRHDHRLQRAPRPQGPRAGGVPATSRSGPTRSSTS